MSKSICIWILSFLLLFGACDNLEVTSDQSDTFIKLYGSWMADIGKDVKVYNDGYIILATSTTVTDETKEIVFLQTDRFGFLKTDVDTLSTDWEGNNYASKLLLTSDGGFIALGTVQDSLGDDTDIYIEKFSSGFTSEWQKIIGTETNNETAASIKAVGGGYIVTGSTDEPNFGNNNAPGKLDIYLIKMDEQGNIEWTQNHGGNGDEYASDVILIEQGFMIVGTTNGFSGPGQSNNNMIVVKTNLNGSAPDMVTYGGSNNDYGTSLIQAVDEGYLILGTVEDVSGNSSDIYVVKIESDIHAITWSKVFGQTNLDDIGSDIITSDNGYIIAGSKEISSGFAGYFVELDATGEIVTENSYGGYGQMINSIESTLNGGYIMTGSSGVEGNEMISLIKVDSGGEL